MRVRRGAALLALLAVAAGVQIAAALPAGAASGQLPQRDGAFDAAAALEPRRALKQLGAVAGLGAGLVEAGAGAALGAGALGLGLGLSGLNAVVPIGGGGGNLLAGAVPFVLRTGAGAAGGAVNAGLGLMSIVNPATYVLMPVRAAPRRSDCVVYTVSGRGGCGCVCCRGGRAHPGLSPSSSPCAAAPVPPRLTPCPSRRPAPRPRPPSPATATTCWPSPAASA
jgi:hypothetical protein